MTGDSQDRLDRIYDAALRLDPSQRLEFVRQACGADEAMRAEIESLLAHAQQLGSFLEKPAWNATTATSVESPIGQMLGPYKVEAMLSAGGMGAVYRAIDTRLGRAVAIKLAAKEFSGRFLAEARAAAALNHPHVCALYDIGPDYLVMELLEGETLAQRVQKGALPLDQTLSWGIQIAEALAAAHARGIIHRDLKPGNIMITAAGIKVLDFGLAKMMVSSAAAESEMATVNMAAAPATQPGTVVGTVAYMSPDQARGEELDERTDLFSLGVVLYEMATGKRPFQGDTNAVLFDAILNRAIIPACELNRKVPPMLDAAIRKALEKDRDLRYQHATELRADLKRLERDSAPQQQAAVSVRPRRTNRLLWGAVGLAALALAVSGYEWWRARAHQAPAITERQITANPPENAVTAAAISPDAKYIAYADPTGLFVRSVDSGETRRLEQPPEAGRSLSSIRWFPDGGKLLVGSFGPKGPFVWGVATVGEATPQMLLRSAENAEVSRDGQYLVFERPAGDIRSVNRENDVWVGGSGGDPPPRQLFRSGGGRRFDPPVWSPDGRWLAYQSGSAALETGDSIDVRPAAGGQPKALLPKSKVPSSRFLYCWSASGLVWLPDGRLLFSVADPSKRGGLWSVRVSTENAEAISEPVRLAEWPDFTVRDLSASTDGKSLAVVKANGHYDVYLGDLDRSGGLSKPHRFTLDNRDNELSGWTADGKSVLFTSFRTGRPGIFSQGLNETLAAPLARGPGVTARPIASPDGNWILYASFDDPVQPKRLRLMRLPVSGGVAEQVLEAPGSEGFAWECPSHAGECIVSRSGAGKGERAFYTLDPARGLGRQIGQIHCCSGPFMSWGWSVSPDGSRLALVDAGVYPGKIQILTVAKSAWNSLAVEQAMGTLTGIGWDADGTGFFGTSKSGRDWNVVHISAAGKVRLLWSAGPNSFAVEPIVSPDGKYLAFDGFTTDSNVWLVQNF